MYPTAGKRIETTRREERLRFSRETNARARTNLSNVLRREYLYVDYSWEIRWTDISAFFSLSLWSCLGSLAPGGPFEQRQGSRESIFFPSLLLFFLSTLMQTGSSPSWRQNDDERRTKRKREGDKTGLSLQVAEKQFSFSLSVHNFFSLFFLPIGLLLPLFSTRHSRFCATSIDLPMTNKP